SQKRTGHSARDDRLIERSHAPRSLPNHNRTVVAVKHVKTSCAPTSVIPSEDARSRSERAPQSRDLVFPERADHGEFSYPAHPWISEERESTQVYEQLSESHPLD